LNVGEIGLLVQIRFKGYCLSWYMIE